MSDRVHLLVTPLQLNLCSGGNEDLGSTHPGDVTCDRCGDDVERLVVRLNGRRPPKS